jgi:hypothetical protein
MDDHGLTAHNYAYTRQLYSPSDSYVRFPQKSHLHLLIFGSHVPSNAGADVALARIAYAVYAYHSLTLWTRFADV